jgi:hypothetical protein
LTAAVPPATTSHHRFCVPERPIAKQRQYPRWRRHSPPEKTSQGVQADWCGQGRRLPLVSPRTLLDCRRTPLTPPMAPSGGARMGWTAADLCFPHGNGRRDCVVKVGRGYREGGGGSWDPPPPPDERSERHRSAARVGTPTDTIPDHKRTTPDTNLGLSSANHGKSQGGGDEVVATPWTGSGTTMGAWGKLAEIDTRSTGQAWRRRSGI